MPLSGTATNYGGGAKWPENLGRRARALAYAKGVLNQPASPKRNE